ncbi:MAG: ABC transporter substrate-binding protein, partial [Lachnospiraceae bacterium]|nr:ABC transporter substrate-binding protein [Lachnospiraceae bacterium]
MRTRNVRNWLLMAAVWLFALLAAGCGTKYGADNRIGHGADCGSAQEESLDAGSSEESAATWDSLTPDYSLKLRYASQFSVDYYRDGMALITIQNKDRYLVIPEQGSVPKGLPEDVTIIQKPLDNIYLAATSAMDLFKSLDRIDAVTLSGTDASGWYIEEAKQALEEGRMQYAGKYSAPDYELILSKDCDLAIESTMIYHSPEVKEQLEALGIPVLVERSSYESHPLGRMEWLMLYAVLLDQEEQAERYLNQQFQQLEPVMSQEATGKTAAFFYVTSN